MLLNTCTFNVRTVSVNVHRPEFSLIWFPISLVIYLYKTEQWHSLNVWRDPSRVLDPSVVTPRLWPAHIVSVCFLVSPRERLGGWTCALCCYGDENGLQGPRWFLITIKILTPPDLQNREDTIALLYLLPKKCVEHVDNRFRWLKRFRKVP